MTDYEFRRRAHRSMVGPHWPEALMLSAISVTAFVWFLALLPLFVVLHLVELVCVKAEPLVEDVQAPIAVSSASAEALSEHKLSA